MLNLAIMKWLVNVAAMQARFIAPERASVSGVFPHKPSGVPRAKRAALKRRNKEAFKCHLKKAKAKK